MSAVSQLSEVAKLLIAKKSFISAKILNGKLIMERYEGDALEVGAVFDSVATSAAIDTAISSLKNSAPSLLDTLGEIDAQLASDESAAAALLTQVTGLKNVTDSTFKTALNNVYSRLSGVQPVVSANGVLVAGAHNPVDATGGSRTMTLADATSAGQLIGVSKKDSSANTVTVSVAHLRDGGAGTIVLVGQYEALLLTSKADGTWWPIGDHKTKAYFDATYAPISLVASKADADGRRVVAAPNGSGGADTGKVADAIAAAKTAGGRALIQLQPGTYSVDPANLALDFDNVMLVGCGQGVTSMTKTGNGDLITIKAANDSGVVQRAQVRDIKLNGGDFTGALIKSVYGSQCHIKGVEFNANNDIALDLIRAWDTALDDVFLDHCGATDGSVPAMSIRNSAASSGFGSSTGQANMIYARALRIESCRRALQVIRGTGSSNDPYGIYFHGFKLETILARGTQIDVVNVRHVSFRDVDLSLLALDSGASAVRVIDWAPLFRSKLDGVRCNIATGVVERVFDMWLPGSGAHEVANVEAEGASAGTGVFYWNNTNKVDVRGAYTQSGTLHAGTPPPETYGGLRTSSQTVSYTLALSDSDQVLEMNSASALNTTVPPNSSVSFPVGTVIEVHQYGAGQVTLVPGSGVTLRTASSLTTRAQYSTVSLRKRATDEWVVTGDLS